jgi:Protein of unknown function (DUF3592)
MKNIVKHSENAWTFAPQNIWKLTLVFVIAGVALLSTAMIWGISTFRFMRTAGFSEGIVEKLELRRAPSRWYVYSPTVAFQDQSGQTRTFIIPGSNPPGFRVRQQVRVAYDPKEPSIAYIVSFRTLWLYPTIFGVVGIVFVLLGSFGTWQARKLYSQET